MTAVRACWQTLFLALLVTPGPGSLCAQNQFQYRQQLTRADGLPGDDVYVITQDNDGFIWLGTTNGLARFDGARFDVFTNVQGDSTTVAGDWISDLEPVGSHLWIGTSRGISRLDLETDRIKNYFLDLQGRRVPFEDPQGGGASLIYHDRLGNIWLGGQEQRRFGWCLYDSATDSFHCRSVPADEVGPEVLSPAEINNVLSLHLDNTADSILWVGTKSGLLRYNIALDQWRHYYYPIEPKSFEVSYNVFRRLWQMPDGRLLVGSWSGGLNIFDPVTGTFGPAPYSNPDMPDAFFQSIREILPKSETEVWVTLFKSLIAYDFVNESITLRLESDFGSKQIYGADFIDRDGRIWSRLYGAHVFDPALQQFIHAPFATLNPDGEGFVFDIVDDRQRDRLTVIARDCDALYHYYPERGTWRKTLFPPAIAAIRRFEGNNGVFLERDRMFVSSFHEVFTYNPATARMSLLEPPMPVQLKAFDDAFKDGGGRVWFGTQIDGVLGWDPVDGTVRAFANDLFLDSIPGHAYIRLIDRQDGIWISCKERIFYHSIAAGETIDMCARHPELCSIGDVDEDLQGRMWFTQENGHAVVVTSGRYPDLKIDTVITLKGQTASIFELHCDSEGWIWAFFVDQILRIDPVTLETMAYSTHYLHDFQDIISTHLVRDRILAVGMANRMVLIDLKALRKNQEQPIPYLSRIDVREEPLASDIVARKLERLDLKHHENFFSLEFSALGYTLSEENEFQYRLTDFQEEWRDAAGRRFANYTNVPSGDYTFELRVFNSEGEMSPHTVTLPVSIRKHWSEMWGIRIFLLLAALGLGYTAYRLRVRQIRREEKMKSDFKMQLADIEMTALRAQMNPHFIFNCLNSIESFIIRNEAVKASQYLNDFARLIRLILQNSGSRSIPLQDELEALELYIKMESLRFADQFDYTIDVDPGIEPANVNIPPLILQPYVENAIWHGLVPKPGKGTITVRISLQEDALHCVIEDDGVGRKRSGEVKKEGKSGKKSMGMAITRNRIELLNAVYQTNTRIEIEDLVAPDGAPAGTRVSLNIPL